MMVITLNNDINDNNNSNNKNLFFFCPQKLSKNFFSLSISLSISLYFSLSLSLFSIFSLSLSLSPFLLKQYHKVHLCPTSPTNPQMEPGAHRNNPPIALQLKAKVKYKQQ